ncbi:hypothetical protein [Streptomyces niveus]|uniref:hypothetical protein n=1 Tax=Streptomyces niveus TaxID=193462 RepID=UPI00341F57C3
MDPVFATGLIVLAGGICRLSYWWIASRAEVQKAALYQQGLTDRARLLSQESRRGRLSERTAGSEVEIVMGDDPRAVGGGCA